MFKLELPTLLCLTQLCKQYSFSLSTLSILSLYTLSLFVSFCLPTHPSSLPPSLLLPFTVPELNCILRVGSRIPILSCVYTTGDEIDSATCSFDSGAPSSCKCRYLKFNIMHEPADSWVERFARFKRCLRIFAENLRYLRTKPRGNYA